MGRSRVRVLSSLRGGGLMRHASFREWSDEVDRMAFEGRPPFDGKGATRLLAFAHVVGRSSKWKTGQGVTLIAARRAFGDRVVRRYVGHLTDALLLTMTRRPTRARHGSGPGRAAEYALMLPEPDSITAHQHAQEWAVITTAQVGSDKRDDDDDGIGALSASLPTCEHESDTPTCTDGTTSARTSLTLDVDRLVRLASRSGDWAGWQVVSSLIGSTSARVA